MEENKPEKQLFEIAVLHHLDDNTNVVVEPQHVLCSSRDTAISMAVRQVPQDFHGDLDDLEILAKPFKNPSSALDIGDLDQYVANNPGTYIIDQGDDGRVLVCTTANGKGYSPVDLLVKGEINRAAQVAARCFGQGL